MARIPTASGNVRLAAPMPRASGAAFGAQVGQAVQGFGQAFDQVADATQQITLADRASRLHEATTQAQLQLKELQESFRDRRDYANFGTAYQEGSAAIRAKLLDGEEDEGFIRGFDSQWQRASMIAGHEVRELAREGVVDQGQARTLRGLDTLADVYARASNGAERAQLRNQARIVLGDAVNAGFYSEADVAKMEMDWEGRVAAGEYMMLIHSDADAAFERLSEPDSRLDESRQHTLRNQAMAAADRQERDRDRATARAEKAAEDAKKERAEEAMKEAYDLAETGELTDEFIESIRDDLSASEYKSIKKLNDPDEVADDPQAIAEIEALMSEDPELALETARRYHANGQITNGTMRSYGTSARSLTRSEGPKSQYARSREYIRGALDPGDMGDPVSKGRMAEAIREFDNWMGRGDRTDEEIDARAQQIVSQFSLVDLRDGFLMLPAPRFGSVRRNPGDLEGMEQDLAVAEAETVRRLQDGDLDEDEFNQEAATLGRWRSQIDRARAAQSQTQ